MMWQPIETAPKDGSSILLATPKGRIADGFWSTVYGVWSWPYVMVEPTHWMPLPGRPSAQAQLAPMAVAYLDLGAGGYMDIGTDLTDEALAALPKGRHMLGIVGTYGVEGYIPAQPAPSFADAYQGAMEESAIWKKRALEAENLNRKFLAEINSPTHMGEPAQPAPSVPDGFVWPECPKRRQSHVLFDDGYEEGWAACISTVKAMLAAAPRQEER